MKEFNFTLIIYILVHVYFFGNNFFEMIFMKYCFLGKYNTIKKHDCELETKTMYKFEIFWGIERRKSKTFPTQAMRERNFQKN